MANRREFLTGIAACAGATALPAAVLETLTFDPMPPLPQAEYYPWRMVAHGFRVWPGDPAVAPVKAILDGEYARLRAALNAQLFDQSKSPRGSHG